MSSDDGIPWFAWQVPDPSNGWWLPLTAPVGEAGRLIPLLARDYETALLLGEYARKHHELTGEPVRLVRVDEWHIIKEVR